MMQPPTESVYFLLVDDLEENLLALAALLRREGLVLLKAKSGIEALELLLKHEIALAILDVQMPDMDGFELAELMRGTERTRRVPIIFVTAGSADQNRRFRGYEAGAVDFLNKPIEPHILKSKADVFFELYRQRQEVARLLVESQQNAEALKEADRRKDEFLAILAHELRNPLAPIRNSLQLIRLSGPQARIVEHACTIMERQLAQLVRLVDDLLDVSRITRGKLELRKERSDLASIIHSAVETSTPVIQEKGHALTVSLPEESIVIDADPTRLAQVFMNLLTNAAKYSEHGGKIWLSAEKQGDQAVKVSVKDTGIGIPADHLPRIFEMFSQVDQSLEKSQGGLGIGLSLVKRLTEMHGGTIEAKSEGPTLGSEFSVRLPLPKGSSL